MNFRNWEELKKLLEDRGFEVQVKGRGRKEYIAIKGNLIIDVYRSGIASGKPEVYFYDDESGNMFHDYSSYNYVQLVNQIKMMIDDYDAGLI